MESNSYQALRKALIGRGDRIDRIENPMVPGMFDVSICLRPGIEFWVEVKNPIEPVRETTSLFGSAHPVLQTQVNWARSQIQAGGLAFFFIDTNRRRIWIHASHAERINSLTVEELKNIALWVADKPTRIEEWKTLENLLRGWTSERPLTLISSKPSS